MRVHLAADALAACLVRIRARARGLVGRCEVLAKAQFLFAPGERATVFRALGDWMRSMPRTASIAWVLGHADVRYLSVPWAPELVDEELRNAVVCALFERQLGLDPGRFEMRFATPSYGHAQLAAIVAKDLLAEIEMHARSVHRRLAGIEPSVSVVLKRFGTTLAKEKGIVRVIDGDRQVVVHHVGSHMEGIVFLPFAAPDAGHPASAFSGGNACRFFGSVPMGGAVPWVEGNRLDLPDAEGFDVAGDASYVFALCGVL